MKKGGFEVVAKHTTWSPSKLGCYEECPAKAMYKYLQKLPDPGGPALVFGSYVHEALEMYVTGRKPKLPKKFLDGTDLEWRSETEEIADELKKKYKKGTVRVELELAFTKDWVKCDWLARDCWCRFKLDIAVFDKKDEPTTAEVIDWKTGKFKPDGEYDDQLKMYCMALLSAYPTLQSCKARLWFTEAGEEVSRENGVLSRTELAMEQKRWAKKAEAMFKDAVHIPTPGPTCRWCPFSTNKDGPCKF